VSKTSTTKNSAIVLAASKEFLDGYYFHSGPGPKKILWHKALEDVLDKFEILSSPNLRNIISSSRNNGKGGFFNSIMSMIRHSIIEHIHSNVFPGQKKEKVYVFKMLVERLGSNVDLIKRMQPGGDLENVWLMFDHANCV
jgi:hypothetical protein